LLRFIDSVDDESHERGGSADDADERERPDRLCQRGRDDDPSDRHENQDVPSQIGGSHVDAGLTLVRPRSEQRVDITIPATEEEREGGAGDGDRFDPESGSQPEPIHSPTAMDEPSARVPAGMISRVCLVPIIS
jgi:hypothetical protein